jgi:predicted tellurium resistance membrane protein TerC
MLDWMTTEDLVALVTLTAFEIILGIDNIVFITVLVARLPESDRRSARFIGLLLAMGTRIALLAGVVWLIALTRPIVQIAGRGLSIKDLVLIAGGLFLIAKATHEIHGQVAAPGGVGGQGRQGKAAFASIIAQIVAIDIVFSFDSVITAVGMAQDLWVMITAVVVAVLLMMAFAGKIAVFIDRNPALRMLAMSFLVLIGVVLVADGLGQHIEKGYIYFAMAFALGVELLNMRARRGE